MLTMFSFSKSNIHLFFIEGIEDVSALGGVRILNLKGCRYISEVSALGGVHTLDVS